MAARFSAGLLVYDLDESGVLHVFLAHMGGPFWARRDVGGWSIPKGEYVPGEEAPLAVAHREFTEEIGALVPGGEMVDLGEHLQPSGKRIRAFAVRSDRSIRFASSNTFQMEWPPRSGRMENFPEVDRAQWFTAAEARVKLVSGQVAVIDALISTLRGAHVPVKED